MTDKLDPEENQLIEQLNHLAVKLAKLKPQHMAYYCVVTNDERQAEVAAGGESFPSKEKAIEDILSKLKDTLNNGGYVEWVDIKPNSITKGCRVGAHYSIL